MSLFYLTQLSILSPIYVSYTVLATEAKLTAVVSWILPDPFLHIGTLATSKFPGSLPSLSKLSTISVKGFSISLATSFNIWDVIHLGWMPRQLLTHWCWEVVLCGGRALHKICYITSGQEVPGDEISGEISHSWSGKTC